MWVSGWDDVSHGLAVCGSPPVSGRPCSCSYLPLRNSLPGSPMFPLLLLNCFSSIFPHALYPSYFHIYPKLILYNTMYSIAVLFCSLVLGFIWSGQTLYTHPAPSWESGQLVVAGDRIVLLLSIKLQPWSLSGQKKTSTGMGEYYIHMIPMYGNG